MIHSMHQSLGDTLRTAREAAKHTLDDVVRETRFPLAAVEALETDDLAFFASPLYARSFLKQYGDYLKVDVSPWLEALVPTALIDENAGDCYVKDSSLDKPKKNNPSPGASSRGSSKFASVILIAITGAMIWLGVLLYETPEKKSAPPAKPPVTPEEKGKEDPPKENPPKP